MRRAVHKIYLKYIPKGSRVLELNAGTGVDAVFLAESGFEVYATDISEEMIKVLMSNAKAQMSNGTIKAKTASFDEISEIGEGDFDAVVSNFGGLNCINDFSGLSCDLAAKLKPGGLFIAVVMNTICPWEILYYTIRLRFGEAFRRFRKNGIMAGLNGEKVLTYYYTPAEFSRRFAPLFTPVKYFTLGYFTPPPYLIGIYNKLKLLVKLFMAMDNFVMNLFPFNRFGDHFIVIMRKKD
jgi:ubiquinone/menaquinone biosynthesis C-methylase UbiE